MQFLSFFLALPWRRTKVLSDIDAVWTVRLSGSTKDKLLASSGSSRYAVFEAGV